MTGNSGANILDGAAGADTMSGGLGNELYVVDNAGDRDRGCSAGIDGVNSSISYTLGANLENLTLRGTKRVSGTGNELSNMRSLVTRERTPSAGPLAADTLNGGAGNDWLYGGTGNDILTGGTGV